MMPLFESMVWLQLEGCSSGPLIPKEHNIIEKSWKKNNLKEPACTDISSTWLLREPIPAANPAENWEAGGSPFPHN